MLVLCKTFSSASPFLVQCLVMIVCLVEVLSAAFRRKRSLQGGKTFVSAPTPTTSVTTSNMFSGFRAGFLASNPPKKLAKDPKQNASVRKKKPPPGINLNGQSNCELQSGKRTTSLSSETVHKPVPQSPSAVAESVPESKSDLPLSKTNSAKKRRRRTRPKAKAKLRCHACERQDCGKVEDTPRVFKKCGRCEVRYCSVKCSELDWKHHKISCSSVQPS